MSKPGLLGQIDAIGADAFHILLVEDDELTLKVTEGLLRHCNYQGANSTAADPAEQELLRTRSHVLPRFAVSLARNGRQALEALQSPEGEHINLILTDVLMPEVRLVPQPYARFCAIANCPGRRSVSVSPTVTLAMQIDGIELMSELLKNESWSHIPIIGKQLLYSYENSQSQGFFESKAAMTCLIDDLP